MHGASAAANIPRATPASPSLHLEAALARITDAVITIDSCGCVTYLNLAAANLTGVALHRAMGSRLAEVFSVIDASGLTVENAIRAAGVADDNVSRETHAVLLGAARRAVAIEFAVSSIRTAEGLVCGAVILFRDAARARAATPEDPRTLFAEKERAQVTLDSIGDAVISTDFRGHVSFLNVMAEKMTGWTQPQASRRHVDESFRLVDSATRSPVPSPAMRAIIEDQTVRVDSACVLLKRDGSERAVEVSASPIHDKDNGVIGAVMVAHDVTVARDLSAKLARLALHDHLTGLPNRTLLLDRLNQELERAKRNGRCVALLFIDLDRFKPVNDSLGHAIGDSLLQEVARRLQSGVRSSDTVCRYGGDEFVVMLADIAQDQDACACACNALNAINAPFHIAEHRLQISASIGIARSYHDLTDPAAIIRHADIAMYRAKSAGPNTYNFFKRATRLSELTEQINLL